jgi:hypothetical protein
MTGLTAKVFRTYNASWTMSQLLQKLKVDDRTMVEKIKLYNDCNREVAILCNHKRTVGAGHEAQMEKLGDRIKGLKYQKWRTKMMMLDLDPKLKKKKGADFFALDPELDETWIEQHQKFLASELKTKIEKKFEKDNEKLVAEGSSKLPGKELKERLKAVTELEAKFKKENKAKKVEAEGKGVTVEKLTAAVEKLDDRISTLEMQSADREGNKEVALGTSKIVSNRASIAHLMTFVANYCSRTTSTRASRSSSRTSSRSQSRSSSPRRSATSSTGPSSRLATTTHGSSERAHGRRCIAFVHIRQPFSHAAAVLGGKTRIALDIPARRWAAAEQFTAAALKNGKAVRSSFI